MGERWRRIEELFARAVEVEPGTRNTFLAGACAGDDALRADVLALLEADQASGGDRFITAAIAGAVGDSLEQLEPSRLGQQVGPYRLLSELGHGGMGTVYLAERIDDQYRAQVAIKFVQGGLASPLLRERFRTERQILADLTHPNIARLLDGGAAPDGTPFLVMERVVGEPIGGYSDSHRLDIPDRLRLFLKVAAAVQYAHQSLVVHRDLKPSNILVTAQGEPMLLDFGIAKLLTEESGAAETTGLRIMTPAFASPEQVRGERVTVGADVYALGGVLYQLLAGREVFDLRGLTPAAVERLVCEAEPERPSRAAGQAGRPPEWSRRLRGDLDTILLKALRKEPAARYASVAALAEDIRRHLAGEPVLARPDTFGYRLGKRLWRHRVGAVTTAGVLIAGFALIGFYTHRLARERDRARLEAAKADEVAGFLRSLFEVSDPARSKGDTVTARELLDEGARRVERELVDQPEVQATMMRVIGEVYQGLGLASKAGPLLEEALARQRARYRDPHPEVATSQTAFAVHLQDEGDLAAAEPLFRQALASRVALHGPDHPAVAESQAHLAFLMETKGDQVAAESLFRAALATSRRVYPADDPHLAKSVVQLGGLLRRTGKSAEAEPLLREGLAAQRRQSGSLDLEVASTARNLAGLLRDRGAFVEAESLYREVLATRRAILGERHPETANALNSYAILLHEKGDTAAAITAYTEHVLLLERIYAKPHPSMAAARSNLAQAWRDAGRLDEAAMEYDRAMAVQERVLPRGHPHRAHPLIGLAIVRMQQRRFADAEPLLRRAVALRRAALPADRAGNLPHRLAPVRRRGIGAGGEPGDPGRVGGVRGGPHPQGRPAPRDAVPGLGAAGPGGAASAGVGGRGGQADRRTGRTGRTSEPPNRRTAEPSR